MSGRKMNNQNYFRCLPPSTDYTASWWHRDALILTADSAPKLRNCEIDSSKQYWFAQLLNEEWWFKERAMKFISAPALAQFFFTGLHWRRRGRINKGQVSKINRGLTWSALRYAPTPRVFLLIGASFNFIFTPPVHPNSPFLCPYRSRSLKKVSPRGDWENWTGNL